ncbi:hypothetical protein [Streptomyces genisteinicus]|uniref:Uncharacterized protein n=1 Tax=Streptomyces genisteinicus TaxID=2768068 RepID=A0A7H0I2J2_9ACTN|nr:hypothetical protein [Streptomyces genisteinicus]QNP67008.1 hypothetical protein IAG43_31615 [Streptomyces genisteinicus]
MSIPRAHHPRELGRASGLLAFHLALIAVGAVTGGIAAPVLFLLTAADAGLLLWCLVGFTTAGRGVRGADGEAS